MHSLHYCYMYVYVCGRLSFAISSNDIDNDNNTAVANISTYRLSAMSNQLPPMSHSSGVYEETYIRPNPLDNSSPPLTILNNEDRISSNNTVSTDSECSTYHRYCSENKYSYYGKNMPNHFPNYCSCDSDCFQFGDCCLDAPISISENPEDVQHELSQLPYTCLDLKEGNSYFVWSKCPDDWIIADIRVQCERDNERFILESGEPPDVLLMMPVTSFANNVTYKNVFCAACNGQRHLAPWNISMQCRPFGNENYNSSDTSLRLPPYCPVRFKFPSEFQNMAQDGVLFSCMDNPIGATCSHTNSSNLLEVENARKCQTFFAPVKGIDLGTVNSYKNKFCAFCNGESQENLTCQTGFDRNMPLHTIYGAMIPHATRKTMIPSFSLLLDIDFSSGGSIVGSSNRCPPGCVYDPWMEVCRDVICGENYEFSDGICVSKPKSENPIDDIGSMPVSTSTPSALIDYCPKIIVSDSYDIDDNETLVFRRNEMAFHKGEYKIESNDTVMICVEVKSYVGKFGQIQSILTIVCITLSLACLLAKMVLFFVVPEPKKMAPKAIFCLSLSLFLAQLLFLVGVGRPEWGVFCTVIGIVTHYCFLGSFVWSNILAYDIWHTFRKSGMPKSSGQSGGFNRFCRYSCYGWLSPLLIVVISVVIDFAPLDFHDWKPRYGEHICWISNRAALMALFACPLAALLMVNMVFFGSTALMIARASKASKMARVNSGQKDHVTFTLYAKLALIMGLTWVFGFVAPFSRNNVVWCFFIVLNGSQGVFIFFAFTKFERVKRKIFRWSISETETTSSGGRRHDNNQIGIAVSKNNFATSNTNITHV